MKNKYFILAFTFLSLLLGQNSYAQERMGDYTIDEMTSFLSDIFEREVATFETDPNTGYILAVNGPDEGGGQHADFVGFVNNNDGTTTVSWGEITIPTTTTTTPSVYLDNLVSSSAWLGYVDFASVYSISLPYNPNGDCYNCNEDNTSSNDVASSDNYYYTSDNYLTYSSGGISSRDFWGTESLSDSFTTSPVDINEYNTFYDSVGIVSSLGVEITSTLDGKVRGKIDLDGNVTILTHDGTYKSPSLLNPEYDKDRLNLTVVAAWLARGLDGKNKGIVFKTKKGDDLSSKNPAWTIGTNIYLNSNGGFSNSLNNVNNFKSILKHEIFHVDDNKIPNFNTIRSLATHADVYIRTANDPTYKNTTLDFRKGNAGSFANYLLNMDTSPDATFNRDVILKMIDEFNKNGTDVKIVIADYYLQKGGLKLQVQYGSQTSEIITKTPINE